MSLFLRFFLANSFSLLIATLVVIFRPVRLSYPIHQVEVLMVLVGFLLMLGVNWTVTKRLVRPWTDFTKTVERIDSPDTPLRLTTGESDEVAALSDAFNAMLDRLDAERENAARHALTAQESERQRVSSELHDEVGQRLTALLLQLKVLTAQATPEQRDDLLSFAEAVRDTLDEVRGISARLRPGVLHDLGLRPALETLRREMSEAGNLRITLTMPEQLLLSPEQELVVYRVTQESLTNVLRHSGATLAIVDLHLDEEELTLTITDDGSGQAGPRGTGVSGMMERARLVRGHLSCTAIPDVGTEVELVIPLQVKEPV